MDAPRSPGWYPDPDRAGAQRWWNGAGWSDARRGMSGAPSRQTPAPDADAPTNGAAAVGAALSFFGLLFVPLSIAGFVVSIIGLRRAARLRAVGENPAGRIPALLGVILSTVTLVGTTLLVLWIGSSALAD
ncbi:DUF2510 domain-containing protein [Schumannella sp. 10F1B-5-1]|uniref:DUF2510 domain-containing protein n=1 Tax=Schumannella sp. 10F1B-5-1 TaxID=2590780 RepID=UPI0011317900|nr:DUF2510 domain-containing protein [Schumannella sp. 10F1B-5-1]TPW70037.1 DUF2510 domain-containing protein [Schumannella sp. 10F1B-5-1]